METRVETQKFAELRAKTDRQLLLLVRRELRAARAAAQHPHSRARAQAAVGTAERMIPKLYGLDDRERTELRAELEDLRSELEDGASRLQAACAGCCA